MPGGPTPGIRGSSIYSSIFGGAPDSNDLAPPIKALAQPALVAASAGASPLTNNATASSSNPSSATTSIFDPSNSIFSSLSEGSSSKSSTPSQAPSKSSSSASAPSSYQAINNAANTNPYYNGATQGQLINQYANDLGVTPEQAQSDLIQAYASNSTTSPYVGLTYGIARGQYSGIPADISDAIQSGTLNPNFNPSSLVIAPPPAPVPASYVTVNNAQSPTVNPNSSNVSAQALTNGGVLTTTTPYGGAATSTVAGAPAATSNSPVLEDLLGSRFTNAISNAKQSTSTPQSIQDAQNTINSYNPQGATLDETNAYYAALGTLGEVVPLNANAAQIQQGATNINPSGYNAPDLSTPQKLNAYYAQQAAASTTTNTITPAPGSGYQDILVAPGVTKQLPTSVINGGIVQTGSWTQSSNGYNFIPTSTTFASNGKTTTIINPTDPLAFYELLGYGYSAQDALQTLQSARSPITLSLAPDSNGQIGISGSYTGPSQPVNAQASQPLSASQLAVNGAQNTTYQDQIPGAALIDLPQGLRQSLKQTQTATPLNMGSETTNTVPIPGLSNMTFSQNSPSTINSIPSNNGIDNILKSLRSDYMALYNTVVPGKFTPEQAQTEQELKQGSLYGSSVPGPIQKLESYAYPGLAQLSNLGTRTLPEIAALTSLPFEASHASNQASDLQVLNAYLNSPQGKSATNQNPILNLNGQTTIDPITLAQAYVWALTPTTTPNPQYTPQPPLNLAPSDTLTNPYTSPTLVGPSPISTLGPANISYAQAATQYAPLQAQNALSNYITGIENYQNNAGYAGNFASSIPLTVAQTLQNTQSPSRLTAYPALAELGLAGAGSVLAPEATAGYGALFGTAGAAATGLSNAIFNQPTTPTALANSFAQNAELGAASALPFTYAEPFLKTLPGAKFLSQPSVAPIFGSGSMVGLTNVQSELQGNGLATPQQDVQSAIFGGILPILPAGVKYLANEARYQLTPGDYNKDIIGRNLQQGAQLHVTEDNTPTKTNQKATVNFYGQQTPLDFLQQYNPDRFSSFPLKAPGETPYTVTLGDGTVVKLDFPAGPERVATPRISYQLGTTTSYNPTDILSATQKTALTEFLNANPNASPQDIADYLNKQSGFVKGGNPFDQTELKDTGTGTGTKVNYATGKKIMGANAGQFIVDEEGNIVYIDNKAYVDAINSGKVSPDAKTAVTRTTTEPDYLDQFKGIQNAGKQLLNQAIGAPSYTEKVPLLNLQKDITPQEVPVSSSRGDVYRLHSIGTTNEIPLTQARTNIPQVIKDYFTGVTTKTPYKYKPVATYQGKYQSDAGLGMPIIQGGEGTNAFAALPDSEVGIEKTYKLNNFYNWLREVQGLEAQPVRKYDLSNVQGVNRQGGFNTVIQKQQPVSPVAGTYEPTYRLNEDTAPSKMTVPLEQVLTSEPGVANQYKGTILDERLPQVRYTDAQGITHIDPSVPTVVKRVGELPQGLDETGFLGLRSKGIDVKAPSGRTGLPADLTLKTLQRDAYGTQLSVDQINKLNDGALTAINNLKVEAAKSSAAVNMYNKPVYTEVYDPLDKTFKKVITSYEQPYATKEPVSDYTKDQIYELDKKVTAALNAIKEDAQIEGDTAVGSMYNKPVYDANGKLVYYKQPFRLPERSVPGAAENQKVLNELNQIKAESSTPGTASHLYDKPVRDSAGNILYYEQPVTTGTTLTESQINAINDRAIKVITELKKAAGIDANNVAHIYDNPIYGKVRNPITGELQDGIIGYKQPFKLPEPKYTPEQLASIDNIVKSYGSELLAVLDSMYPEYRAPGAYEGRQLTRALNTINDIGANIQAQSYQSPELQEGLNNINKVAQGVFGKPIEQYSESDINSMASRIAKALRITTPVKIKLVDTNTNPADIANIGAKSKSVLVGSDVEGLTLPYSKGGSVIPINLDNIIRSAAPGNEGYLGQQLATNPKANLFDLIGHELTHVQYPNMDFGDMPARGWAPDVDLNHLNDVFPTNRGVDEQITEALYQHELRTNPRLSALRDALTSPEQQTVSSTQEQSVTEGKNTPTNNPSVVNSGNEAELMKPRSTAAKAPAQERVVPANPALLTAPGVPEEILQPGPTLNTPAPTTDTSLTPAFTVNQNATTAPVSMTAQGISTAPQSIPIPTVTTGITNTVKTFLNSNTSLSNTQINNIANSLANELTNKVEVALSNAVNQGVSHSNATALANDISQSVSQNLANELNQQLGEELSHELAQNLSLQLSQDLAQQLALDLSEQLNTMLIPYPTPIKKPLRRNLEYRTLRSAPTVEYASAVSPILFPSLEQGPVNAALLKSPLLGINVYGPANEEAALSIHNANTLSKARPRRFVADYSDQNAYA